jgi:hypothetical protein
MIANCVGTHNGNFPQDGTDPSGQAKNGAQYAEPANPPEWWKRQAEVISAFIVAEWDHLGQAERNAYAALFAAYAGWSQGLAKGLSEWFESASITYCEGSTPGIDVV